MGGIRTQSVLLQPEIQADVNQSNLASVLGGFVPAVADDIINSEGARRANNAVTPVRDALVDFSFETMYQATVRQTVEALGLRVDFLVFNPPPLAKGERHPDGVQLWVKSSYRLLPDFSVLYVSTDVSLRRFKSGREELLMMTNLQSQHRLPGWVAGTTSRAAAAERWAADGGAAAREALSLGLEETRLLMEFVLTTDPASLPPALKKGQWAGPEGSRRPGRVWQKLPYSFVIRSQ